MRPRPGARDQLSFGTEVILCDFFGLALDTVTQGYIHMYTAVDVVPGLRLFHSVVGMIHTYRLHESIL